MKNYTDSNKNTPRKIFFCSNIKQYLHRTSAKRDKPKASYFNLSQWTLDKGRYGYWMVWYFLRSWKWQLLSYSSCLYVLPCRLIFVHFSVSVFCCFPLIVDVSHSVLDCNPDLFLFQTIYDFRTSVYYCCLILTQIDQLQTSLLEWAMYFYRLSSCQVPFVRYDMTMITNCIQISFIYQKWFP